MCLTMPHSPNKATALLFKTQLLFLVERQGAALGACAPNPPCVFCAKPLLVFLSRTHIFQGSDCKSDFNPIKSQLGAETNIGSCYLPRPQRDNSGVLIPVGVDSRKACALETVQGSRGFQMLGVRRRASGACYCRHLHEGVPSPLRWASTRYLSSGGHHSVPRGRH